MISESYDLGIPLPYDGSDAEVLEYVSNFSCIIQHDKPNGVASFADHDENLTRLYQTQPGTLL